MLLISDSNIIIDMHDGGLLEAMFGLPDDFAVPDVLFEEELEPNYPELRRLGLKICELTSASIDYVIQLQPTHGHLGNNDLFAWALARQERCPLLTGDQRLARAARAAGIQVRGTLWLMQRLMEARLVTAAGAAQAYGLMLEAGSRLPWDEVARQLARWGVRLHKS